MKVIKDDRILDTSPDLIAKIVCENNSTWKAMFLNECAALMDKWDKSYEFQLEFITKEKALNLSDRNLMAALGEYSDPPIKFNKS